MAVDLASRPVLKFRGRSLLAFTLAPEAPLADWLASLDASLARAPDFFRGKPVLVDATGCRNDPSSIVEAVAAITARGIRVMGLDGIDPSAAPAGLPPVVTGSRTVAEDLRGEQSAPRRIESLLIEAPVRSGQTISHDGDVTIVGSVASGADVIAGGSIHIYGALRGRAFAGATGNPKARIFCRKLEAELVAIDGFYTLAEAMDPGVLRKTVQVQLAGETVHITPVA